MMMEELNKIETLNTYFPEKELLEDESFKEGVLKLGGQKSVMITESDFSLDIVLNKWKDYLLRKYESDLLFLVELLELREFV